MARSLLLVLLFLAAAVLIGKPILADEPMSHYIFPAGGQRGTTVNVRVGGTFFHERAKWEMLGAGVTVPPEIAQTQTVWFEGPPLHHPDSSRKEEYPLDHAATVAIAADAAPGARTWRVWTSQGVTKNRPFIIGELPEVVEAEAETGLAPMPVSLPVTINGRIFPREEIDVWTFEAAANQEVTCDLVAKRIGSPLEGRLELRDPAGNVLAESISGTKGDPQLRFRAAAAGRYELRVHDVNYEGQQEFVYRLTVTAGPYVEAVYPLGGRRGAAQSLQLVGQAVPAEVSFAFPADAKDRQTQSLEINGQKTNLITFAVSDLPELREAEPNNTAAQVQPVSLPAVLNGRIEQPGDVDLWAFKVEKGTVLELDLLAARLGSQLDSVLSILDAEGKVLAKSDDLGGVETDSQLNFTVPDEQIYYAQVKERFATRGGLKFGYRLQVSSIPAMAEPDFKVSVEDDVVTVFRNLPNGPDGKPEVRQPQLRTLNQPTVRVNLLRLNKFTDEVQIVVEGLPAGVTVSGDKIGQNGPNTQLRFTAAPEAKIDIARLKIKGVAKVGEKMIERVASYPGGAYPAADHVLLGVALDAPYRMVSDFAMLFGAAGSIHEKEYRVIRFGYAGPIQVRLSDRQMRHLQGVTGPTLTVPAGATSFVYSITLAPWMNLGRTSRTVLMGSATITDHDGTQHVVSYHSDHQNEQVVAIIKPGLLIVALPHPQARLAPGSQIALPVTIQRSEALRGQAVRLEVIPPAGVTGFTAEPVTVAATENAGELVVQCAADAALPEFPLLVRATTLSETAPNVAEAKLELLPAK